MAFSEPIKVLFTSFRSLIDSVGLSGSTLGTRTTLWKYVVYILKHSLSKGCGICVVSGVVGITKRPK